MGGNNEFFENFERNKYLKKLPSMQRVKEIQAGIIPREFMKGEVVSNLFSIGLW